MFEVTSTWRSSYPEAHAGVLVMRAVSNPLHHAALESQKAALEQELRKQFSGHDRAAIASHPTLRAYAEYYRQFKKTYHIQLQLESIVLKGKSIPSVAALVEAMFMAEMKDWLLTAGHDLDTLHLPLTSPRAVLTYSAPWESAFSVWLRLVMSILPPRRTDPRVHWLV